MCVSGRELEVVRELGLGTSKFNLNYPRMKLSGLKLKVNQIYLEPNFVTQSLVRCRQAVLIILFKWTCPSRWDTQQELTLSRKRAK